MSGDRIVYSSRRGRVCPHCGLAEKRCVCRANPRGPKTPAVDGVVRVRREVKGRRGKTVTTISGVPGSREDLRDLCAELKRRCGSGGSLVEGVIELQGDHRELIVAQLESRGYEVKLAGG